MLTWLTGWKLYAAGALAAGVLAWGYGQWKYQAGYSAAETDQERQELREFRSSVQTLHTASERIYSVSAQLQTTIPVIIQGYDHETTLSPLDVGCGPISAGRMLNIKAAIEKAAAARQSGRAVP